MLQNMDLGLTENIKREKVSCLGELASTARFRMRGKFDNRLLEEETLACYSHVEALKGDDKRRARATQRRLN
jgi:hypothetical protein